MIDLDEEALALAAKELGTTSETDTVNAALAFVARGRRSSGAHLLDDPKAFGVGLDAGNDEILPEARRRSPRLPPDTPT